MLRYFAISILVRKTVTYFIAIIASFEKGEANFSKITIANKHIDFQLCDKHDKTAWK